MKLNKNKWLILLLAGVMVGCESDDDTDDLIEEPVEYTSGTADFTHYVAIGNSLTAGFTDGALIMARQQSYRPNILARQFGVAAGGHFTKPMMSGNTVDFLLGGTPIQ